MPNNNKKSSNSLEICCLRMLAQVGVMMKQPWAIPLVLVLIIFVSIQFFPRSSEYVNDFFICRVK